MIGESMKDGEMRVQQADTLEVHSEFNPRPCPFCGSEARYINEHEYHLVMCNKV